MSQEGRSELFIYMGVAFAVAGGLFFLQTVYASYIDMSYHAELKTHGANEKLMAQREAEAQTLQSGKLSIDAAKQVIAEKGRSGHNTIAPTPSDDLSPISGWIRRPGFKPAVAHPIRLPRAEPAVTAVPPAEAAAPAPAAAPQTH
jgi:hypothetical protein